MREYRWVLSRFPDAPLHDFGVLLPTPDMPIAEAVNALWADYCIRVGLAETARCIVYDARTGKELDPKTTARQIDPDADIEVRLVRKAEKEAA